MEKKGSRSVQPSAKGLSSDSKKSQDVASTKQWPRSGRRREPTGGSLGTKGESSRKPTPQRAVKTYDVKRPRARGTINSGSAIGRTETTRIEDEFEAELGSVFQPGSKKQSLNHLLNFVYATPERERYQSERGFNNNTSNRLILTRKHKYNKEHFLQANCQFVVNTSGDYKQYMNNPDALVDWNLIEQINVQVSDYPSCPICLYPPVAAKITRCGHIYCWSCLLHYLSLSDKAWRKCPICYESVHKQDLKSVTSRYYKTLNVNDVITFKLMKRPKGSLVTYPASAIVHDEEMFSFSEIDNVEACSKLLLSNKSEILSIVDRENNELSTQLLENGECPENCFIEEAMNLCNERRDSVLKTYEDKPATTHLENILPEISPDASNNNPTGSENLHISTTSQQSKFHYFYQASDGQHIYLHAINARMLEHTYGSLEKGPLTITGKILEKEGGSMTEELRKRLRYLQHLPVTCQFEVAEIQLKSPTINKETLDFYNEQIEIRKKRRQRRAREEKRREKKIADEENRLMGKYPTPNLHIESQTQFPCFESRPRTESEGTQPSEESTSEAATPSNSLSSELEHAGPSFAKMLASVKKTENMKWPELKPKETPVKLINVTGQKLTTNFSALSLSKTDSDPENEDFEPIPPNTSLGDAIVQALQKADTIAETAVTLSGKKKKMKNRQKVLFTTNVAFTGK